MLRMCHSFAVGIAIMSGLAARVLAQQLVFLDFGSPTVAAQMGDQGIFFEGEGANRQPLITLQMGARLGFVPTDLGYANNNNRAALIGNIVDQVRADYQTAANVPYNITFVTNRPVAGDFSTLSLVAGRFPNFTVFPEANRNINVVFNVTTQRATFVGGRENGRYVDLTPGGTFQVFRADGTAIAGQTQPAFAQFSTIATAGIGEA